MTHRLERRTEMRVPLEEVFAFFEDPRNLADITPPWLHFTILNPDSVDMRKGAVIDYQIRWMGLRLRWQTVIADYDPPRRFVDEQARGPYSYWRHEHIFQSIEGGVAIEDRVDYRLPFGVLGEVAHYLIVRKQLETIFDYRESAIVRLLTGKP